MPIKPWSWWKARERKSPTRKRKPGLLLESLERRVLLTGQTVYWTGAASDSSWSDLTNWVAANGQAVTIVPGGTNANDIVLVAPQYPTLGGGGNTFSNLSTPQIINVDGSANYALQEIDVSAPNVTINLPSNSELSFTSGSRLLTTNDGTTGDAVNLQGGVLSTAIISATTTVTATTSGGTLDGVELAGTLNLSNSSVIATVTDGLILDAGINVQLSGNTSQLIFAGSAQAVSGTGTFTLNGGSNNLDNASANVVTLNSGITVTSSIVNSTNSMIGSFDNLGTIQETGLEGVLQILGGSFVNDTTGTLEASGGGTVEVTDTGWTNNGHIIADSTGAPLRCSCMAVGPTVAGP